LLENLKCVVQNVLVILIAGITKDESTFRACNMRSFIAVHTATDDTETWIAAIDISFVI